MRGEVSTRYPVARGSLRAVPPAALALLGALAWLAGEAQAQGPGRVTRTARVSRTDGRAAAQGGLEAAMARTGIPMMPVSEVRAGMKGYGLTVFRGTTIEKFKVEVIDILHNFLPKQDIILIRCDDPKLAKSGIVAGMSGSPIYLEGKLVGALAYGWRFSKEPIAGVTPIAKMLETAYRPLRGIERTPLAMRPRPAAGDGTTGGSAGNLAAASAGGAASGSGSALVPTLVPMSLPLALAGFAPAEAEKLARALKPFNIVAMAGGGTGGGAAKAAGRSASGLRTVSARESKNPFQPGSAIGVQLIRGDMAATGTGTVTFVDGNRVLAFGHPMFNVGEVYLPVSTARVHTVLPSVERSVKLASPIEEVASLVQDRQPGIVADTTRRVTMIPMSIHVDAGTRGPRRTFNIEVVRHRFLTPVLAASAVGNAISEAASDVADATFSVRTHVHVRNQKPLVLTDNIYSPQGLTGALEEARGVRALGEILFNPFEPAQIDRVDVHVKVEYKADVAEITGAYFTRTELEPGKPATLYVKLRPYNGVEETRAVTVNVPRTVAGQTIRVVLSSGQLARPESAPPTNLRQVIRNLEKGYPSTSLAVTLRTITDGVKIRGAVIPDLPPSAVDALLPAASTLRGTTFKSAARIIQPIGRVLYGTAEIQIKVAEHEHGGG